VRVTTKRENLVRNTTCSEQIVYSAIETTCFGLYWPSSGVYNIEEESVNAEYTICSEQVVFRTKFSFYM